MFQDLLKHISEGQLYPPQKFGSLICIPVIERSGHGKPKALATRECLSCVKVSGLGGIGKRGIQVTAKSFTDETLTENKALSLDLIMTVITKMNGDIQKYFKICGTGNLSDKAKLLIEERWTKHKKPVSIPPSQPENTRLLGKERQRNTSRAPSARGSMPSFSSPSKESSSRVKSRKSSASNERSSNQHEELPFKLRLGNKAKSESPKSVDRLGPIPRDGPFTFNYDTKKTQMHSDADNNYSQTKKLSLFQEWEQQQGSAERSETPITSIDSYPEVDGVAVLESKTQSATGAAVSLRARLQQIRNKHRTSSSGNKNAVSPYDLLPQPPSPKRTDDAGAILQPLLPPVENNSNPFSEVMKQFNFLLGQPKPFSEHDRYLLAVIESLEKLHASLTKITLPNHDYSIVELKELRQCVKSDINSFTDQLIRCVHTFAFSINLLLAQVFYSFI